MLVNQIKELDQVTVIYDKNDIPELKEALEVIQKTHYCFNYEPNKSYSFRLKPNTKVLSKRKEPKMVKTGFTGVYFVKSTGNYNVSLKLPEKKLYLGTRRTAEEAFQLRLDYIEKHNLQGYESGKKIR